MNDHEKLLVKVWRMEVADKECNDSDEILLNVIKIVEMHHPGTIEKLDRIADTKWARQKLDAATERIEKAR